ncbi:hypothetical protein G7054_g12008 [Neopestalotiopsis clavispora]|nr:hypothetical protein G7054_g12008 [Neopestalotiopsis clavispora]
MAPPNCIRIVTYYACGCRKDNVPICPAQCSHASPMLSIRLIPNGCNSRQVTFQRAQYRQRSPPRTTACTMANPEMEGFVREEDTAGGEPHFSLDGFDGLGEVLSQVIPSHVDGNYEDEIRKRYAALRNEVLLRRITPVSPSLTICREVEEVVVAPSPISLSRDDEPACAGLRTVLSSPRHVGVIGNGRKKQPVNDDKADDEEDVDDDDSDEDEILLPFRPGHFSARRRVAASSAQRQQTTTTPRLSIADLLVDSTPDFDEHKVSTTFGTTANWIKTQEGEDAMFLPFMPSYLKSV